MRFIDSTVVILFCGFLIPRYCEGQSLKPVLSTHLGAALVTDDFTNNIDGFEAVPALSGGLSFGAESSSKKIFHYGFDIEVVLLRAKIQEQLANTSPNKLIHNYRVVTIGLPSFVGINIQQFTIRFGAVPSYIIYDRLFVDGRAFNPGGTQTPQVEVNIFDKVFELSGLVGLDYMVKENLKIGLSFRPGLTNLAYIGDPFVRTRRISRAFLMARYILQNE